MKIFIMGEMDKSIRMAERLVSVDKHEIVGRWWASKEDTSIYVGKEALKVADVLLWVPGSDGPTPDQLVLWGYAMSLPCEKLVVCSPYAGRGPNPISNHVLGAAPVLHDSRLLSERLKALAESIASEEPSL